MRKILKPKSFLVFALALSFIWMRESFGQTPEVESSETYRIEIVDAKK